MAAAKLVRYVSPFGSPASMSPEEAERYLAQDTLLFETCEEHGLLTDSQRRVGAPRIGDEHFRHNHLPIWIPVTDEDRFETIRALCRRAESLKRDYADTWVVIERNGEYAVTCPRYVIEGDNEIWRAA